MRKSYAAYALVLQGHDFINVRHNVIFDTANYKSHIQNDSKLSESPTQYTLTDPWEFRTHKEVSPKPFRHIFEKSWKFYWKYSYSRSCIMFQLLRFSQAMGAEVTAILK